MDNIIFIGGIHGVGKTTLCNKLSHQLQLESHSASKIISNMKKQNLPSNKLIPNININQAFLIEGLNQLETEKHWMILDGHFCLLDGKKNISKISEAVFKVIKPAALIVITDSVKNIASRLKNRDDEEYDLKFLKQFQNEETAYARHIAKKFSIPIYIFNSSDESSSSLIQFITNLGVI
ncbi:ATP-binding protein [Paenibacillus faecis]|uniref:ATP-binding protein n=1 Tax=Paenibacillus faecis TaxID=862114 RepID=UPI0014786466|nr:ATP-binding protein [Paenibacillus faecis]